MKEADTPIPFAGCFYPEGAAPLKTADAPVFLGICDDTQSSYCRGARDGPEAIRRHYDGRCYNPSSESGVDLAGLVEDGGDLLPAESWAESAERYRTRAEGLLSARRIPFVAGGDHAVTVPLVAATAVLEEPIHVIQLDAHSDLYPEFGGNPHSHACTAARLLEMVHVVGISQLGVRTLNPPQRQVVREAGGRLWICEASQVGAILPGLDHIPRGQAVYLTLDMDVFEPAFAPGVSHPVPGGLTPRQVLDFIQTLPGRLIGMDVVEVNPSRDEGGRTAVLAGRLLHEGMARAVHGSAPAG